MHRDVSDGNALDPFLNRPLPDLFFVSEPHRAAWTFLRRALRSGTPLILLTGDFGAGKTMLALRLVQAIQERRLGPCIHVSAPPQGAAAVLRRLVEAAGLDPATLPEDPDSLARALHAQLANDAPAQRIFLVLEDAQDMDEETIARLLQAAPGRRDGRAAMTTVLIGHTSLPRLLKRGRLRWFDTRIRKRHHLAPLDPAQTRAYIEFRLARAEETDGGIPLPRFDTSALDRVFELTRGNPREINNLCGTSLTQALARQLTLIERDTVDAAAHALGGPRPAPGPSAPIAVQFPGRARAGRSVRGCPDYVRPQASTEAPSPGPSAASSQTLASGQQTGPGQAAARDSGSVPSPSHLPEWRRPGPAGATAGVLLLLAAAYLSAPYLSPDVPGSDPDTASAQTTVDSADPAELSRTNRRGVTTSQQSLNAPLYRGSIPKPSGTVTPARSATTAADGAVPASAPHIHDPQVPDPQAPDLQVTDPQAVDPNAQGPHANGGPTSDDNSPRVVQFAARSTLAPGLAVDWEAPVDPIHQGDNAADEVAGPGSSATGGMLEEHVAARTDGGTAEKAPETGQPRDTGTPLTATPPPPVPRGVVGSATSATPHTETARYSVQIGAFRDRANALTRAAKVSVAGYDVRIVHELATRSRLYKVRFGAFDARPAAMTYARQLSDELGIETWPVRN